MILSDIHTQVSARVETLARDFFATSPRGTGQNRCSSCNASDYLWDGAVCRICGHEVKDFQVVSTLLMSGVDHWQLLSNAMRLRAIHALNKRDVRNGLLAKAVFADSELNAMIHSGSLA